MHAGVSPAQHICMQVSRQPSTYASRCLASSAHVHVHAGVSPAQHICMQASHQPSTYASRCLASPAHMHAGVSPAQNICMQVSRQPIQHICMQALSGLHLLWWLLTRSSTPCHKPSIVQAIHPLMSYTQAAAAYPLICNAGPDHDRSAILADQPHVCRFCPACYLIWPPVGP